MGKMSQPLGMLFRARNAAVHPQSAFGPPAYHPELQTGVDPRFVTFTASNCVGAVDLAIAVIQNCTRAKPRPELTDWSNDFVAVILKPIVEEWLQSYPRP
jgi:hypothetical protein